MERFEATLSQTQCAEIALLMLSEYRKYLQGTHFTVLPFDQWLKKIVEHDPHPSPNTLRIEPIESN